MKKMLLVSMFQNASGILKKIEPELKGKTVTYIPTASAAEPLGFFVKIGKYGVGRGTATGTVPCRLCPDFGPHWPEVERGLVP